MTDHRRIQRALFRMQHDAAFAARVATREPGAVAATHLSPADLDMVLAAGPTGIAADPGGKRLAQFLRNVSSELALTAAWAAASGADGALVASFPASARFHDCVDSGGRLPLAFGEHALERTERTGDRLLVALARLELALARARRGGFERPAPARGEIALAPRAEIVPLPDGTMDAATTLRSALDAGHALPARLAVAAHAEEHVLVASTDQGPHRLREVSVELLGGLAGALLLAAREALDGDAIARFAATHDVARAELDEFVGELERDGIVVRGR